MYEKRLLTTNELMEYLHMCRKTAVSFSKACGACKAISPRKNLHDIYIIEDTLKNMGSKKEMQYKTEKQSWKEKREQLGLRTGESFRKNDNRYMYRKTIKGRNICFYADTLQELRAKESYLAMGFLNIPTYLELSDENIRLSEQVKMLEKEISDLKFRIHALEHSEEWIEIPSDNIQDKKQTDYDVDETFDFNVFYADVIAKQREDKNEII